MQVCWQRRKSGNVHRRDIAGVIYFGVATPRCVGTIVSSLESSASQDILICDGYIAHSATTETSYLLVPQIEVADVCAMLVANASHQIV
jgi:hypothetical protein